MSVFALRRLWRRWTSIVELYARQLPLRGRVNPRSYALLHRDLVTACEALAASSRNGRREFYEDLRDLARPWLSPWILQQSDREILLDLLERCQNVQRELGGAGWLRPLVRPVVTGTAFLASATISALVVWYTQPMWASAMDQLDDSYRLFLLGVKKFGAVDWLLFTGGVGVVLAMFAVSRVGWRR